MTKNWIDDIAPLFTQYDVIQMKIMFDLSNYNDVKAEAKAILKSLSPVPPNKPPRMPKDEDPWTPAMLDTFRQWMDGGYWYSATSIDPPLQPPADLLLPVFIALSEFLTGFDNLRQDQQLIQVAQAYLIRIRKETLEGAKLDALLEELAPYVSDPQAFDFQIRANSKVFVPPVPPATEPRLSALAHIVVILWYTATIQDKQDVFVFGTPQENQYIHALMWPAVDAEPMGYSTRAFGYWQEPSSDFE